MDSHGLSSCSWGVLNLYSLQEKRVAQVLINGHLLLDCGSRMLNAREMLNVRRDSGLPSRYIIYGLERDQFASLIVGQYSYLARKRYEHRMFFG